MAGMATDSAHFLSGGGDDLGWMLMGLVGGAVHVIAVHIKTRVSFV